MSEQKLVSWAAVVLFIFVALLPYVCYIGAWNSKIVTQFILKFALGLLTPQM